MDTNRHHPTTPDPGPAPIADRPEWAPSSRLAARCNLIAMPALVILTLPVILAMMIAFTPDPPRSRWADDAERLGVRAADLFWGEMAFRNTCAVCHGKDANGIPKLGKPLRNSPFVQSLTDEQLMAQIAQGRPATDAENTTGVPMPARGGDAALDDTRLRDVVYYIRTLQEPGAPAPALDAWVVDRSAGNGAAPAGVGHDTFVAACSSCHGADAMGVPDLGKPLKTSRFVAEHSDDELVAFVKQGRPIWDPLNTTGLDMPPKGGNPALTEDQIKEIIAYIRSIHTDEGAN